MIPATLKIELTLGTIAGCSQILHETGEYDSLWLKAIYDCSLEILTKWPKRKYKNRRQAIRYIKRMEKILEEIEKRLKGKWKSLGQIMNFFLALVITRYDELQRHNSKRAKELEPLIEMLEQYVNTLNADKSQVIDEAVELIDIFENMII